MRHDNLYENTTNPDVFTEIKTLLTWLTSIPLSIIYYWLFLDSGVFGIWSKIENIQDYHVIDIFILLKVNKVEQKKDNPKQRTLFALFPIPLSTEKTTQSLLNASLPYQRDGFKFIIQKCW